MAKGKKAAEKFDSDAYGEVIKIHESPEVQEILPSLVDDMLERMRYMDEEHSLRMGLGELWKTLLKRRKDLEKLTLEQLVFCVINVTDQRADVLARVETRRQQLRALNELLKELGGDSLEA